MPTYPSDDSYYVKYSDAVQLPSNGDYVELTVYANEGDNVVSGGFAVNPDGDSVSVTASSPMGTSSTGLHFDGPGDPASAPGGWYVRAALTGTPASTQYLRAYAVCKHTA